MGKKCQKCGNEWAGEKTEFGFILCPACQEEAQEVITNWINN